MGIDRPRYATPETGPQQLSLQLTVLIDAQTARHTIETYGAFCADPVQVRNDRVTVHAQGKKPVQLVAGIGPAGLGLLQPRNRTVFDEHLADQRSAWDMQSDGSYRQRQPSDESSVSCQQQLAEMAHERDRQAKRLKRRKPRVIGRRNAGIASPKA